MNFVTYFCFPLLKNNMAGKIINTKFKHAKKEQVNFGCRDYSTIKNKKGRLATLFNVPVF